MSTFTTSRNTRGQHVSPRQCVVRRQSPTLRLRIHGQMQWPHDQRNPMWWRVGRGIVLVSAMYALKIAVMG